MSRVGSHRSDRRWKAPNGVEWASQFEWSVFEGLRSDGYRVRKCDQGDTVAYNSSVRQGRCLECGSAGVVQERKYTADLFVVEDTEAGGREGYLIECKGYFPRDKRSLFCSLAKQLEGVNLRIVFEINGKLKGTKLTHVTYIHKYAKNVIPGVWNKKTGKVVWYENPKHK